MLLAAASSLLSASLLVAAAETPRNVVVVFADDLGPGEVSHAGGVVATPHADRLAEEGTRFSDAHTTSSVCTPSRYSLLTGRYAWRTRLQSGVFLNVAAKPLIAPEEETLASLCRRAGMRTAVFGKWHLGLGWERSDAGPAAAPPEGANTFGSWTVDYERPFAGGPLALGFDRFVGVCSSLDMPPYLFLADDRAEELPTTNKRWVRWGAAAEDFEAEDALARLGAEAASFIAESAAADEPFFVYVPLTSPHTPVVPSADFRGRTGLGDYADFLVETDHVLGHVLGALDASGVTDETLVLFTSDNGFAPYVKIPELEAAGQRPSAGWRGAKADIYEGGHRVPFLVRWPGRVAAGATEERTVSTADVLATLAELLDVTLREGAGVDSFSFAPALLGREQASRPFTVHHSINGSFAIRKGRWKLCLCPGSGGWSAPRPEKAWADESFPRVQLFDLAEDPGETENVAARHPALVEALAARLARTIERGRSTPGPDAPVAGRPRFRDSLLARLPVLAR